MVPRQVELKHRRDCVVMPLVTNMLLTQSLAASKVGRTQTNLPLTDMPPPQSSITA